MHDHQDLRGLARKCRMMTKPSLQPSVNEQLWLWAAELADYADETERCSEDFAKLSGRQREGEGAMTEERARYCAEKLAFNLRITFYVVRSAEDEIYAVQVPSDDCEILAIVPPSASVHDQRAA
jgi:hypothetical protein